MLTKARAAVGETYVFKKGYSRSKSSSGTDSEKSTQPGTKRKKIMAVERHQEINNLEEVIKSTNDQIEIKRQRLQRAKNFNDFALCDILSSAITALLVKKADHERQLTARNKKDAKSKKYLLKKVSKNPSQGRMSQKKNTSILDMMCMKKTGVEIGKQSTDSQVIVVEEEQSVIERGESSSSGDTLILEKSDEVPKQSADYQEDQSVLERSESSSSGDTLILEKSDEVPKQSADYQEDQSVLERSESSSSGNTLILEKSDEVPKEFDDIADLSDEDVFGNILPVKDASVTNL